MGPELQNVQSNPPPEQNGKSKRTVFNVALLVFVMVLPAIIYFSFFHADDRIPLNATIGSIEGSVMVQLAGKAETVPAEEGMELSEGDRIITGVDGSMELFLADGSLSRVAPDSRIDIISLYIDADGADITVLNVDGGGLWNAVMSIVDRNSRFEVNTPSSVAGVRGTNYYVRVDDQDETLVRCYEGEVGFSQTSDNSSKTSYRWFTRHAYASVNETLLGPYQQSRSRPGVPPPPDPDPIDPLDVDDFEKGNLVEDQPEAYVEVGLQASTILAEQTEESINETAIEMEMLNKEIAYLEELLAAETDPARIAELENLINKLIDEKEFNSKLLKLLEDDLKDMLEQKNMFEELRKSIEEISPEELREKARAVREREKENDNQRNSRQEQASYEQGKIKETREEVITGSQNLGIDGELRRIREDDSLDPDSDPDPEPHPDPDPEPDPDPPESSDPGDSDPGDSREDDTGDDHVEPDSYRIRLSRTPPGGGAVTGAGTFDSGSAVTVMASPAEGYRFVNWTAGGSVVSSSREYTFTASDNLSLVANFALISYDLSVFADPSGGGSVSGGGSYDHNEQVTVEAVPEEGYRFAGWFENGEKVSDELNYTFRAKGDRNLKAEFVLHEYNVSLSADPPEGGSVSGGGTYEHGMEVVLNAYSSDDYEFVRWTENGEKVSTDAGYTFTASKDRNLTAVFVYVLEYTVNVNTDPEEAGVVSGRGVYEHGTTATVEVLQVSDGFIFEKWLEDGEPVSDNPVYSFEVTGDRNLVASFQRAQYNISLSARPEEAGEVAGSGIYDFGTTAIAVTTANPGYIFTGWYEDETMVHVDSSYSFQVNRDRTMVAIFTYDEEEPPEYDPPAAVSFVPGDNATGVSTDTEIRVTFDRDVTEAVDGALNNVTLVATGNHVPVTGMSASLANKTIIVTHPGLDYDTEYTVTVPRLTVISGEDQPNEEISWSFTTEPEPEPTYTIYDITARYYKVSEAIYVGYIIFQINGAPGNLAVSVNGGHPFTNIGTENGSYIFEGITEEKPETVTITVDDETYSPGVNWEDTTDDQQE